MTVVETVQGQLPTEDLGRVLMHEHVFVINHERKVNYPESWNDDLRVADAVQKFQRLKSAGIDTIVDLTVLGLGRDIALVQRVAEQSPVNILAATGFYTFTELPTYLRLQGPGRLIDVDDPLEEMFVADIEKGIGGTSVKAAILKCATDIPGVTPDVERVLRGVARAHVRTGVPISTHTDPETKRGLEQQQIFREEGVDLGRVVIGHSGDTEDIPYLEELIAQGSYLGMDRFGLNDRLSFNKRVAVVAKLVELGYADRLVLSHDASCHSHNFPDEFRSRRLPQWHYTHITDDVLPALRAAGVSDDAISTMLIHNPRAIFESQVSA